MLTKPINREISDFHAPCEVPGLSVLTSRVRRFHDCLDEALEQHRDKGDEKLYAVAVLESLAQGCARMALPQPFAVRMATFQTALFGDDTVLIQTVFKTAYLRQQAANVPLEAVRPSALLAFKTEAYLNEHYVMRRNVMTGVAEYKVRGLGYGFQPLDRTVRNTMAIQALKAGVDSWDRDINRYIDSTLIPQYNPLADFLTHLPRWDGRDRVTLLAQRVKTENTYWARDFRLWMRSMVAQWMGKDVHHGNAIVPVLIGPQGSGKTTFCRRLLPETLQTYYNDRLPMRNDTDILMAMASYALINIDEFDALKRSQQPILKYLVSKHDVKLRPPYGKAVVQRQRYASFIATTNNVRPLVDTTGSRRFLCVYAPHIDNAGSIAYKQLYAQLLHEVESGQRYWLTDADNCRVMRQNVLFQQIKDYESMIAATFLLPEATAPEAPYMTLSNIIAELSQLFPNLSLTNNMRSTIGKLLKNMGYNTKRSNRETLYQVNLLARLHKSA